MTRLLPLLIALTFALPSVAENADPNAANKALVRDLFDAISRADVSKLDELYADDFEIWTAGALPISGTRTRAQALDGMKMIDGMFPNGITFEILAMTAEGDRVAVEAVSKGMHASGLAYNNEYHFLVVIRDGKVARFKEYMDTLHAKEVLLAAPKEGAPTSP